jgi:hypothetical protein
VDSGIYTEVNYWLKELDNPKLGAEGTYPLWCGFQDVDKTTCGLQDLDDGELWSPGTVLFWCVF